MLQSILEDYSQRLITRYGDKLSKDQYSALNAMTRCKQESTNELFVQCQQCDYSTRVPQSCGHRSCNQCQNHSTQQWLDRQLHKQLPVNYFMATFTLPSELRSTAMQQPKIVFNLLIQSAASTLKRFGLNEKNFNAELGLCVVLHTHTRRLDYHPHVHIVIPGGGIHKARKEWRKIKGKYLFNGRSLAKVFRAEFLQQLKEAGITVPITPKQWVTQCKKVGKGTQALTYLARYLYRGVISNKNIIHDDGTHVTFQYKDSKTKEWKTRTLAGETFIFLLLQHVLPKGFRRARDYGYLHGNAKRTLKIIQWVLKVEPPPKLEKRRAEFSCKHCNGIMHASGIILARASPR